MAPIEDFEQIALVYMTHIYRAAVAICGRSDVADDMVQTTFLKAYERFGSFALGTNCKAWLLRILRNSWIDYLRRERKNVERHVPLEDTIAAPQTTEETVWSNAGDLLDNFTDDQVIKALQRLPDDQRLTLYLVDVEQLSQEEVAEVTGVAVGTVKSRSSRARNALKDRLAAYAKDMHFSGGDL
jgi:RNA polymerase sigma-70 factor (ECF subfamily)